MSANENENEMLINADRLQPVVVHGGRLSWMPSPQPGVRRRMLERIGGEVALATSIVNYRPGSSFSAHVHELGEEFLVLDGVFHDEHGSYPAGTYVRNPPGSSHAPFSGEGCTIFVKLRQMANNDNAAVRVFPHQHAWENVAEGIDRSGLYSNSSITVELLKMKTGSKLPARHVHNGEEIFVINGRIALADSNDSELERWGWIRSPSQNNSALVSVTESLLWVKRGHLGRSGSCG